jgi:type II secretory ATPase GspE/PulE/Tfp pilus assembly ATPase PilB-like protein
VLPIEGRVRSLLGAPTEEIMAAAVAQGMTTVRQDGLRLCLAGITSVEEVLRVVGS